MANNTTNFVLRLRTQGFDEAADKAKKIKDNLEAAAAAARQIGPNLQTGGSGTATPVPSRPAPQPGGSPGSRNLSQSPAANPGGAISDMDSEGEGYRRQRGVIGTGASARDFARQSQGLGGLVRVYATIAANVFALTAAFNALNEAANVQNLIKGLDQLSASSGKNLTSVAKDLVKITDGSLSLQQAFKVVAQASTAGISTENIRRLGEVAQKSAQVLGLDAATAIDRLSRGITKLEPELLDELGLFTKIGPATEAYARQVGKSSLALTDFERRQAFANAVLAEGEQKFSAIAIQANPYARLAAQLKELTISALDFVNKGLIPIITFLSNSPVALAAAVALVAKSILGFAVPAIASWRNDMKAAAEAAREQAQAAVNARREQRAWRDSVLGVAAAERSRVAALESTQKTSKLVADAAIQNNRAISADTKKILSGIDPSLTNTRALTAAQLQSAERTLEALERRKAALETAAQTSSRPARATAEAQEIGKTTAALRERIAAEKEFNKILNEPRPGRLSAAAEDDRNARRFLQDAQKKSIISNALETQSLSGLVSGFKTLVEGINNARKGIDSTGAAITDGTPKMGMLAALTTGAAGAFQLLGAALSGVLAVINKIFLVIGIVTAAIAALDFWFSNTKKETDAFKDATSKLEGTIKTAADALDVIANKKFLDAKSVQSTATALNELTDGLQKQIRTFIDLRSAQNGWDRWWDDRWSSIGKGSEDAVAKNITDTILTALSLVENKDRDRVAKQFRDVIDLQGVDIFNRQELRKAITEQVKQGLINYEQLPPVLREISREANNSATSLIALDSGLTEISKLVNDLNNNLKFSDTVGKLGTSLLDESERVSKALGDTKTGIIALQKVVGDFNLISLFPPERADELARARGEISKLSEEYQKAETAVRQLRKREMMATDPSERADIAGKLKLAEQNLAQIVEKSQKVVDKFKGTIESGIIEAAFSKIQQSLKNAIVQAGIESARGYLSVLSSLGGSTARQETELKLQELGIQRELINANFNQTQEMIRLRLVAEQQLQLDTILLNIKRRETAAAESAAAKQAKERAQKIIGGADLELRQQFANRPLAPGQTPPEGAVVTSQNALGTKYFDKAAFDKELSALRQLAGQVVKEEAEIIEEANAAIVTASKAFMEASSAKYKFFRENSVDSKAVAEAAKTSGTFSSGIAKQLAVNSAQLQAALAKIDAQIGPLKLEGKVKELEQATKEKISAQERRAESLDIEIRRLELVKQLGGQYSEQANAELKNLELNKQYADSQKEILVNLGEQEKLQTFILASRAELAKLESDKKAKPEDLAKQRENIQGAEALLAAVRERRTNLDNKAAQERFSVENKYAQERVTEELRLLKITENAKKQAAEEGRQLRSEQLNLEEAILEIYSKQEGAEQKVVAKKRQEIGLLRLQLESESQIASIRERYQQQLDPLKERRARISAAIEASRVVEEDSQGGRSLMDTDSTVKLQAELTAVDAETKKVNDQLQAAIVLYEKIFGIKLDIFNITDKQAKREADLADLAQRQAERASSLGSSLDLAAQAFAGNFTTALKGVATAVDSATASEETYNLKKQQQTNIVTELTALEQKQGGLNQTQAKQKADAIRTISKLDKQQTIDQFANQAKIAGQAKLLFKEKTAAFKILAAIEKANTIASLAANAQVMVANLVSLPGKIAGGVAQLFNQGGFAGFAGAAAFLALMASLGAKSGGSASEPPKGFSMEEQRQTEGTGKSWVNGQLVDTGGGKPGGGDGRASSLEKGLDLVAKYTFEGLNYSNGMLKALLQIEENTRSAAYAVFRSMNPSDKSTFVGGIQTGQLRPNYLRTGAANTLGAAAGVAGGAVLGSAIAFAGSSFAAGGLLGSVAGKVAGFLGGALSTGMAIALPVIGLLLAKPLGKLFGKIFGGKVTQSIEDSGIVIEGTLNSIIDGTKGVVEEYANLKTVKDRGIFRKKGVSFSTVEQEAQADVKRYFAGIFSGMRDTLKEAGKLLGKDVSAFLDTYVVKDFKVSSKGRTAEEFADALRGEVSEAFNKMAQAAFPELEKFADAGEEFGQTVIRMAKQISVFDTAMKMIGRGGLSSTNLRNILSNASVTATTTRQVSTGTTTGTRQVEFDQEVTQQEYDEISAGFVLVNRFVRSISTVPVAIEQFTTVTETSVRRLTATEINDVVLNITDTLIDLAGGMEQFLERAQAIRENFLTDAQKVGQIAAEIRPILDDLGVGSIRSKADFLTILNDAQDNLVTAATNLKAAELTADTADDAPAQEAFDLAAALVTTLMELAPGIAQVLDYEKKLATAREDQAMTIANLLGDEKLITAARDAQRARQLEDMDVALRPGQRYIWALEDEKRIKDELIKLQEDQIKKLEQTKSTVSNLIKTLSDFKSQLLGGSQTILTPQQVYQQKKAEYDALVTAASSSDENIRNSALAKLPQAASSFLDASRTMFASGTAYAADFNSVIQTLDAQGAELLSQEEYLAKQLTEMQTATDQLKGINTNTQDTATRMAMLEEALVTSQAAVATAAAMWTSSSGEPIANFLTSTSNGANVVAAINNASANTATQNSQLAQATVGSIVQLGIDVDKSLEKWLKEYGWKNTATASYDNAGP